MIWVQSKDNKDVWRSDRWTYNANSTETYPPCISHEDLKGTAFYLNGLDGLKVAQRQAILAVFEDAQKFIERVNVPEPEGYGYLGYFTSEGGEVCDVFRDDDEDFTVVSRSSGEYDVWVIWENLTSRYGLFTAVSQ